MVLSSLFVIKGFVVCRNPNQAANVNAPVVKTKQNQISNRKMGNLDSKLGTMIVSLG